MNAAPRSAVASEENRQPSPSVAEDPLPASAAELKSECVGPQREARRPLSVQTNETHPARPAAGRESSEGPPKGAADRSGPSPFDSAPTRTPREAVIEFSPDSTVLSPLESPPGTLGAATSNSSGSLRRGDGAAPEASSDNGSLLQPQELLMRASEEAAGAVDNESFSMESFVTALQDESTHQLVDTLPSMEMQTSLNQSRMTDIGVDMSSVRYSPRYDLATPTVRAADSPFQTTPCVDDVERTPFSAASFDELSPVSETNDWPARRASARLDRGSVWLPTPSPSLRAAPDGVESTTPVGRCSVASVAVNNWTSPTTASDGNEVCSAKSSTPEQDGSWVGPSRLATQSCLYRIREDVVVEPLANLPAQTLSVVDELEDRVEQLHREKCILEAQLAISRSRSTVLDERVMTDYQMLRKENMSLQQEMQTVTTTANETLALAANKIGCLQNEISGLKNELSELKNKNSAFKKENSDLKKALELYKIKNNAAL